MANAKGETIKCGTCNLGKQQKTANPAKHVENKNPGELKKDALQPGQVIFSDQYQTNVPDKPMKTMDGTGAVQPYQGQTIFCDAASGYIIHVKHQVVLTSYKTIAAKVNFKRLAIKAGVMVTSYHTDNSIYRSSEFMKEIYLKGQGIKMSRVSMQFQNGVSENTIKNTVARAHTMMLHATL